MNAMPSSITEIIEDVDPEEQKKKTEKKKKKFVRVAIEEDSEDDEPRIEDVTGNNKPATTNKI